MRDTPINELNRDGPEPNKLPVARRSTGKAVTPMQMIDKALASGATPEILDKLMSLQERWEANEAKKAFDLAIAQFRAEIKPIIKERTAAMDLKTGGKASYQYEDMALIAEAVDPILARLGLSYRYKSHVLGGTNVAGQAGQMIITCIISHQQGHREEASLPAPLDTTGAKNAVQAVGSTVTYLQRYTLKLGLGLAAAKDDDVKRPTGEDQEATVSQEQFETLNKLLEQTGKTEDDLYIFLGLPPDTELHTLPARFFQKAAVGMRKFIDDHKPAPQPGEPRDI